LQQWHSPGNGSASPTNTLNINRNDNPPKNKNTNNTNINPLYNNTRPKEQKKANALPPKTTTRRRNTRVLPQRKRSRRAKDCPSSSHPTLTYIPNPEHLSHTHSQTNPPSLLKTEQNQLRRPTKTPPHRHSRKMPRNPLAGLQPQDRPQPPRPTARHPPQRRPVPLGHSRRRQEEALRQCRQEEQAEIQEAGRGEGSRLGSCRDTDTTARPSGGTARTDRPNEKSTPLVR